MMARDGAWCGSCAGGLGWVMTWRRARMVLLSTQGMGVPAIAKVACAKSKPADHDLPFPVLKLVEAGGVPGRRGVVDDISREGLRSCSARRASAPEDLEGLQGPELCREEGPGGAPVRDRRRRGGPGGGRTRDDLLHGRTRAVEPAAPSGPALGRDQRQERGTRTPATAADPRGRRQMARESQAAGTAYCAAGQAASL